jgi:hypothetical protein
MRYLLITGDGRSIGIAQKLEREGHAVFVHIVDPSCQHKGTGLVSLTKTPRPIKDRDGVYNVSAVEWLMNTARPDITLFDTNDTHVLASRMQRSGRQVIGAISDTVPLQSDGGLDRPPRPVQYAIEFWFNGASVVPPYSVLTLYTKLFNDDKGPYCPSTGAVSRRIDAIDMHRASIDPIESLLKKTSYRGPVTAYLSPLTGAVEWFDTGLEPSNFLTFENLRGDLSSFLVDIAHTSNAAHELLEEYAVMVRVTLPPWPYNVPLTSACLPIHGIDDANLRHLWLDDVQLRAGEYSTTGASNCIGFVSARAETLRDAKRRVYRTIRHLESDVLQCRTDIASEHLLTPTHA